MSSVWPGSGWNEPLMVVIKDPKIEQKELRQWSKKQEARWNKSCNPNHMMVSKLKKK